MSIHMIYVKQKKCCFGDTNKHEYKVDVKKYSIEKTNTLFFCLNHNSINSLHDYLTPHYATNTC